MTFTTQVKSIINSGLNRVGLQLDTLTAQRRETRRLQALQEAGYFDEPAFPVPASFRRVSPQSIFDDLLKHAPRFGDFTDPSRNPVGFSFDNGFFTSPDAEILYCIIRRYEPRRIVEVGSGNSTKISRLALMDGGIDARLISIDPRPRADIDELADQSCRVSVEDLEDLSVFTELAEDDLLFIDSSHELRAGNDLTHLYLRVFPLLASGVLIHIHDVFLPYDYRPDWVMTQRLPYAEQYLIQAMLQSNGNFEVIWPGYYLQRTIAGFSERFPHRRSRDAQSLWLRTC
jgi:predicted O-methyltransferase YrrM